MSEKKKFDYRHIVCLLVTLGVVACGVFVFPNAFSRLVESVKDFGLSVAYFFCETFGIEYGFTPTVNELPTLQIIPSLGGGATTTLPETWDGFKSNWGTYWQLWATSDNFIGYLLYVSDLLFTLCKVIIIALPIILFFYVYLSRYLKNENNDYDKDSRPLKAFKWFTAHVYTPVKTWVIGMYCFIRERKGYWVTWLCLWLFYFNAFTIVIEFFAFYFYFMGSFDISSIYRQVYKLCLDLWAIFDFIPVWAWVVVGLIVMDHIRKKIAYARLRHFELRNRGFINARPIVYMVCGTMGKKKTTAITDMALSQEVMLRDKAFEKLLENDLKFSCFPWIILENELKRAMEHHEIYSLATVKVWVRKKAIRWNKAPNREKLFDYDYERYGLTYDNKLKVTTVWEVIETYAQLYFIYVIQSSLLIANYSVRVDNVLADLGNFPMWNNDFFKSDSRLVDSYSRHAHILDFDSLRLGRKIVEENRNSDSFEFGVVVITEVGKERGNSIELQDKKKNADCANQKNDLFNSWLKMVRHSATVDNFPFVRVITDEQRPESWGADARDLCEIVHIRNSGDMSLAMPFFSFAELLYDWLFGRFTRLYYKYRFVRSDNTLPMYLLKAFVAKINHYYTGIYNRFGFCTLSVQIESGTQDGQYDENKYFLMSKKIYSKRFSTDCFSDFFTEKALRSSIGINDLLEYATEKATIDELQLQNSYFINDLLKGL